jgi:hypothetical protein
MVGVGYHCGATTAPCQDWSQLEVQTLAMPVECADNSRYEREFLMIGAGVHSLESRADRPRELEAVTTQN